MNCFVCKESFVLILLIYLVRQFKNLVSISKVSFPYDTTRDAPNAFDSVKNIEGKTKRSKMIRRPQNNETNIQQLEFIHIPKTGGSAIEEMARHNGIAWGQCAFLPKGMADCPGTRVPAILKYDNECFRGNSLWHIPPRSFEERECTKTNNNYTIGNPYINNRSLFAIVRNPYDRLLSEYYFRKQLILKKPLDEINQPDELNRFVSNILRQLIGTTQNEKIYYTMDAHLIPQYDYIFYSDGEQYVEHILRFENLQDDFGQLMELYKQNATDWTFPKPDAIRPQSQKLLSPLDLTKESVNLIQRYYKQDFEMFHYEKNYKRIIRQN